MFCMLAMSACWNAGSGVKPFPSPSTIPSSASSTIIKEKTIIKIIFVIYNRQNKRRHCNFRDKKNIQPKMLRHILVCKSPIYAK